MTRPADAVSLAARVSVGAMPEGWRVWCEGGTVYATGKTTAELVSFVVWTCRPVGLRLVCTSRKRSDATGDYVGRPIRGTGWLGRAAMAIQREAFLCARAAVLERECVEAARAERELPRLARCAG